MKLHEPSHHHSPFGSGIEASVVLIGTKAAVALRSYTTRDQTSITVRKHSYWSHGRQSLCSIILNPARSSVSVCLRWQPVSSPIAAVHETIESRKHGARPAVASEVLPADTQLGWVQVVLHRLFRTLSGLKNGSDMSAA